MMNKIATLVGLVLIILSIVWAQMFQQYSAVLFAVWAIAITYIMDRLSGINWNS